MDLSELFTKYGSDKQRNGYTPLYTILFDHLRDRPMNIAEIGIGTMIPNVCSSMVGYALDHYKPGGSLRAWRDFFGNSTIYGFDIQPDTQFQDERIKTFLCDSSDNNVLRYTIESGKLPMFDIVIDDGNHTSDSQYKTLANFFPYLTDGGVYVIEDIYPGSEVSQNPAKLQDIIGNHPYFFSGDRKSVV